MFELVFLGTAASRPTAERGLPALMVLHETERFLIDCGEGTQRQLMRAGLGFRRLKRVFLTHDHLDHVLGLGGLIASLAEAPERRALTIYASAATRALAERFLGEVVLPETDAHLDVHFETLHADAAVATDSVIVRAVPVKHRGGESFGFLFEEPAHRPFDAARAHALGVAPGNERQKLRSGKAVRLADGRTVAPDDVLGQPESGLRLLVIGDAAEVRSLLPYARDVDGLVIEATFLQHERDKARLYGHLTARDAAELARDAEVGMLVLTHISARYDGPEILAEARAVFPAAQLASDLARFRIVKAKSGSGVRRPFS